MRTGNQRGVDGEGKVGYEMTWFDRLGFGWMVHSCRMLEKCAGFSPFFLSYMRGINGILFDIELRSFMMRLSSIQGELKKSEYSEI